MVHASIGGSYVEEGESKVWNNAQAYSVSKIMKLMIRADEFQEIATYGTLNIEDEFVVDPAILAQARLKGLERLNFVLRQLVGNTHFAVKKIDKQLMTNFATKLKELAKIMIDRNLFSGTIVDQIKHKRAIIIYEPSFLKILEEHVKIKDSINEPLNRAELIYVNSEEFDPDKIKAELAEDLVFGG